MSIDQCPLDGNDYAGEFAAMQERQLERARIAKVGTIVYGGKGTGKTTLAATGRQPILFHMFDPGGENSIRHRLAPHEDIYVDARYADDDPKKPTAFRAWEDEFDRLYNSGFFNSIGTYVLDSGTTWSDAAMNYILYKRGKPGAKPEWPEYHLQQITLVDHIKRILSLPCNFVLAGHIDTEKDELSGSKFRDVLMQGKLRVKIPLLFDEVYMTIAKESGSNGRKFSVITQPTDTFTACTRLGANGVFDAVEEPDLKYLLKKAGLPYEDLFV